MAATRSKPKVTGLSAEHRQWADAHVGQPVSALDGDEIVSGTVLSHRLVDGRVMFTVDSGEVGREVFLGVPPLSAVEQQAVIDQADTEIAEASRPIFDEVDDEPNAAQIALQESLKRTTPEE